MCTAERALKIVSQVVEVLTSPVGEFDLVDGVGRGLQEKLRRAADSSYFLTYLAENYQGPGRAAQIVEAFAIPEK